MKHYVYRDNSKGGQIILACDATDILEADKNFTMHFASPATRDISVEVMEIVGNGAGVCVLPHSVRGQYLIRSAPDKKPKSPKPINLSPARFAGVKLFPHVTPRQFFSCCFYCGVEMTSDGIRRRTKDHVTPRSQGGKVKVPCCHDCNRLKGSLKLEEYRVLVAYRNGLIPLDILQQVKFKGEELSEFDID